MVETVIVGNDSMEHKHRGNLQVSYGQTMIGTVDDVLPDLIH